MLPAGWDGPAAIAWRFRGARFDRARTSHGGTRFVDLDQCRDALRAIESRRLSGNRRNQYDGTGSMPLSSFDACAGRDSSPSLLPSPPSANRDQPEDPPRRSFPCLRRWRGGVAALALGAGALTLLDPAPAHAIPAFARQTGLVCSACHEGFPQLNDFGRMFKLNGYVLGGSYPGIKNLSAMVQFGFTHFNEGVPGGAAPGFSDNNVTALQQISGFYGGAIYAPLGLGAFVQYTYDGVGHVWDWDNTDIRLAQTANVLGKDLVVGLTLNNSPSVADLWNTLPAWGYPFIDSAVGFGTGNFAPYMATLAQAVWGGGPYFDYAGWIYGELDIYRTLSNGQSNALNGGEATGISSPGVIAYGRLALHHTFGNNSFELGVFGLTASPEPMGPIRGFGTDHINNVGLDAMYQWISGVNAVTVNAAYTHEQDSWYASSSPYLPNGALVDNSGDFADYFNANVQYLWNQKIGAVAGYFYNSGSADATLYGTNNGKPNTKGYSLELDYYPFNNGGPKFFPWMNAKLFLSETFYTMFNGSANNYDGSGRNARDNNTFFVGAWFVF
jgi:hypothetical protein